MRRRILQVIAVVVVVGGTALAWHVAAGARTPGQRAAEAAPPPASVITAKVTDDVLVDSVTLSGVFTRANTVAVRGPATVATGAAVVTKLPVAAGAQVDNGTLVAEVSGRPLIALTGSFPAYRDLGEGDKGPDVTQLQNALKARYRTPVTGVFDQRTAADVRKLYAAVGYDPVVRPESPGTVRVLAAEVAFVPDLPAVVTTLGAKVGDTAEAELLTLASGAWQVVTGVPAGLEQSIAGARLVGGAGAAQGKAATMLTVQPAPRPAEAPTGDTTAQQSEPESEAVFGLEGDVPGVTAGQAQDIVVERGRSPAGTLVVPASALFTRADGTAEVTVVVDGRKRAVPVEVVMSHEGQAAVTGRLSAGDDVLVGG
jgi:hypothetical protein